MLEQVRVQVTTKLHRRRIFFHERLNATSSKIHTGELRTRNPDFLRFVTQAPRSSFKHLILSSPSLLQGLRKMSMLKMVHDHLKPQECERIKLREPPPVPYVPEKDKVQEEVPKRETWRSRLL